MLELLRTWWPVLLLVYVPFLVRTAMHVAFSRAMRRLDESHPDDLPLTAGEWLAREIAQRGLGWRLRTMVTDDEEQGTLDAFYPFHDAIQLSGDTHFKRDPMHWAAAAHELGHARFHLEFPRLGRATVAALYLKLSLVATASALLIGNVAFALPHVTDAALVMFAACIALHGFVLGDELIASLYAMEMLRAAPEFGPSHLRSARLKLAGAFSTYAVTFLGRVLLLTQWPLVDELTRDALVPPVAKLTVLGTVLAAALSIVLVVALLVRALDRLRRLRGRAAMLGKLWVLLADPALIGLLLLVWNTSAAPGFAWCVLIALVSVQGYFLAGLRLPMVLVDVFLISRLERWWSVDATHRTPELARDYEAGWEQRQLGNSVLARLRELSQMYPPLELRLHAVVHLCSLPLLIALWVV